MNERPRSEGPNGEDDIPQVEFPEGLHSKLMRDLDSELHALQNTSQQPPSLPPEGCIVKGIKLPFRIVGRIFSRPHKRR